MLFRAGAGVKIGILNNEFGFMKTMNFIPLKSYDSIRFGMTREEIRGILGDDYVEFKRNEFSKNSSDSYDNLNLIVEYDETDICEAIELDRGIVYHDGTNLFQLSFSNLKKVYIPKSNNYKEESEEISFYDLGFSCIGDEEEDEVVSILLFSKDYW
jgi:hypothetical protein